MVQKAAALPMTYGGTVEIHVIFGILIVIALFIGFIQFMFMAIIRSNRPAVDIENE